MAFSFSRRSSSFFLSFDLYLYKIGGVDARVGDFAFGFIYENSSFLSGVSHLSFFLFSFDS
jgi:hypothetical protein